MFFNQTIHLLLCCVKQVHWPVTFDHEKWFFYPSESLSTFSFSSKSSLWNFDIDTDVAISDSVIVCSFICLRTKTKKMFRILTPSNVESSWWFFFRCSYYSSICFKDEQWTFDDVFTFKNCFSCNTSLFFHITLCSGYQGSYFTNEDINALAFRARSGLGESAESMVP